MRGFFLRLTFVFHKSEIGAAMFREIYKFLASLKLAMLLLAVIIVASAAGTVYESAFSADIAKRYVYCAPWFNAWLIMLCVNLFCVAAIRYPWKPHQTGFVITHAGIIILLIGGMIDRGWGVEGYLTLYRDMPPIQVMELRDQEVLVFEEGNDVPAHTRLNKDSFSEKDTGYPVKSPIPDVQIKLLSVQPVKAVREMVETPNGMPMVELALQGNMPRQSISLALGRSENLGRMATLRFLPRARLPQVETFKVFAKQDLERTQKNGPPTGAEAKLLVADGQPPLLDLALQGKKFQIKIEDNKTTPLDGLPGWSVKIDRYHPDLKLNGHGDASLGGAPENPALVFDLIGPNVLEAPRPLKKAGEAHDPESGAPNNVVSVYVDEEQGTFSYLLESGQTPPFSGEAKLGEPFDLKWGSTNTKLTIERYLPRAAMREAYVPLPPGAAKSKMKNMPVGAQCEITAGGDRQTIWLVQTQALEVAVEWHNLSPKNTNPPAACTTLVEVGGKKLRLAFGNRTMTLPFSVGLRKVHAPFHEGTTSFMAFESVLSFNDESDILRLKDPLPPGSILNEDKEAVDNIKDFADADDPQLLEGAISEEAPSHVKFVVNGGGFQEYYISREAVASIQKSTHKISMNSPTTFPINWHGGWTGLTYKFSQADVREDNPNFSGVQVIRDPGWAPKWLGSLMICFGIFTMFYLKPYFSGRKKSAQAQAKPDAAAKTKKPREQVQA
jgi:hypothetical protein